MTKWRKETLCLPARPFFADELTHADGRPVPVLFSYSSHVVPVPADWPPHVHVTGYWFLDEGKNWEPPHDLLDFLAAGAPPIFISFGSMAGRHPAQTARTVLEALAQAGQRGVIVTGWGGLRIADVPPQVYVAPFIPYGWLLPRAAAVVHHGGAGTTAAGLRAGKPTVICPFVADQPFWGRRVAALGVGTAPISQRQLTAEKLALALQQVMSNSPMQQRAAELGTRIQAEDGLGMALRRIEDVLSA